MNVVNGGAGYSTDFWLDIAQGHRSNLTMYAINGVNTTLSNSSQEDISDQGGKFVPPSVATALEIVSSDADDTFGGNGTGVVIVSYLDSSLALQSETVLMNGTTPVAMVASPLRVRSITGVQSGSNRVNEGTITLREPGPGQTWVQISVGNNFSFSAFYTVPANKVAYVVNVATTLAKNDEAEFEPHLILADLTEISGQPFALFEGSIDRRLRAPFQLVAGNDLVFRGESLSAGTANVTVIAEIVEVAV